MQSGLRARNGADITGAGMFAVSNDGSLAVIRGAVAGPEENHLMWETAGGKSTSADPVSGAPTGDRLVSRISPDGLRAFAVVITPLRDEVWLVDRTRNLWTRCSDCRTGTGWSGAWSPDGRRLVSSRADALVVKAIDETAPEEQLIQEQNHSLVATGLAIGWPNPLSLVCHRIANRH